MSWQLISGGGKDSGECYFAGMSSHLQYNPFRPICVTKYEKCNLNMCNKNVSINYLLLKCIKSCFILHDQHVFLPKYLKYLFIEAK